jgi:hypothetical protein
MTSSDAASRSKNLLEEAHRLESLGFQRMSVVETARAEELRDLYEEIGHEVVILEGALPEEGHECDACLAAPGLVTVFVKKR